MLADSGLSNTATTSLLKIDEEANTLVRTFGHMYLNKGEGKVTMSKKMQLIVNDDNTIYSSEPISSMEDGTEKAKEWMGSHCLVKIVSGDTLVKVLQDPSSLQGKK